MPDHRIPTFTPRHSHLLPTVGVLDQLLKPWTPPVPAKHREIIGLQSVPVPNLHPVAPTLGQLAEEAVEICGEIPAVLMISAVAPAQLGRQHPMFLRKGSHRPQEGVYEQFA
jgi:hypothetical protein